MLKGPKRIIYHASDLEKAKQWYREVLGADPVFDSPLAVIFMVNDLALILAPGAEAPRGGAGASAEGAAGENVIVGWAVDDAVASYRRLLELGATPHRELAVGGGVRWGSVRDPFGNTIGIVSDVAASEKTVEQKSSDTARGVASMRFLASLEEREEIRGPDYLAEAFAHEEAKALRADPAKRRWVLANLFPPGMYLGHIARTFWFDAVVKEALASGVPQVVFLGAGYDSRPYRFADLIGGACVFEVDAPTTQEHKKELLRRADIPIPDRLSFVPADLAEGSLAEALNGAGFDRSRMTLYVWEGVTYYLPAGAVDLTLRFIRENSPPGSSVCFDYYSTFPGMDEAYGVKEQREFMETNTPGERMQFGIERDRVGSFLDERGFALAEHLSPEEMEKKYLILKDGSPAGKTIASMCYVRATVM